MERQKAELESALAAVQAQAVQSSGGASYDALTEAERRRAEAVRAREEAEETARAAQKRDLEAVKSLKAEVQRRIALEDVAIAAEKRARQAAANAELDAEGLRSKLNASVESSEESFRRLAQLEAEMNSIREKHQWAERELEKTKGELRMAQYPTVGPEQAASNAKLDATNRSYNIPTLAELSHQVPSWQEMEEMMKARREAEAALQPSPAGGSVDHAKLAGLETMNDRLRSELLMMSLMRLEITHLARDKRGLEREVGYLERQLEMADSDDTTAVEMLLQAERERDEAKRDRGRMEKVAEASLQIEKDRNSLKAELAVALGGSPDEYKGIVQQAQEARGALKDALAKRKAAEDRLEALQDDLIVAQKGVRHMADLEKQTKEAHSASRLHETLAKEATAKANQAENSLRQAKQGQEAAEEALARSVSALSAREREVVEAKAEAKSLERSTGDLDRKLAAIQKRHTAEVAAHRTAIGAKNAAEHALEKLEQDMYKSGALPAQGSRQDTQGEVRNLQEALAIATAELSQRQTSLETLTLERSTMDAARAHEMALSAARQSDSQQVEIQQRQKEAQERFETQRRELKQELTAARAESTTLMGTVTEMQAERKMVWKERDKAIEAEFSRTLSVYSNNG